MMKEDHGVAMVFLIPDRYSVGLTLISGLVGFGGQEVCLPGYDEAACCCKDDGSCYEVGRSESGSGLFDDGGFRGDIGGGEDCAGVSVEDGSDLGGIVIGEGKVHGFYCQCGVFGVLEDFIFAAV